MAANNYDACEANVLRSEGGYTNNPADPGGPTNYGITLHDAQAYWKHDATAADVKAMPLAVAQAIYRAKYWAALDCDALPAGLDYTLFDYGVNSGIARAGKVLRRTLGLADTDWHVTADVLGAIGRHAVPALIEAINQERLAFLQGLKTWPVFGRGWGARVKSVDAISQHMAAVAAQSSSPPAPAAPAPAAPAQPAAPAPQPAPAAAPAAPPPPPAPNAEAPSGKGVDTIGQLLAHVFHAGDFKVRI